MTGVAGFGAPTMGPAVGAGRAPPLTSVRATPAATTPRAARRPDLIITVIDPLLPDPNPVDLRGRRQLGPLGDGVVAEAEGAREGDEEGLAERRCAEGRQSV